MKKRSSKCNTLPSRRGKEVVEEHDEGKKPQSRGKTNAKKEDKREAASHALPATLQGMIADKDSRKEKRRQNKEEQIRPSWRYKTKKLALEAEKQGKMLEIKATKAATKAREVWLSCMMKGVEIMNMDLNTVSPRKRS
ncbi:Helicase SKI2W [Hordeum vulgare]|nr:Helicase SKI2W [Hordeum vulgare]